MSTEAKREIVQRLTQEFWNEGNAAVLDEAFAADFVDHGATPGSAPGREGLKQTVIPFRDAFSAIHTTVDDVVIEGDEVAWRWTFRGTHTAPVMGIPATGKAITLTGISIDRFVGDTIVERWNQADFMGMMQQLGVIPTSGQ